MKKNIIKIEKEEIWHKIFNILPVGVAVLDKNRKMIDFNASLGKILHISNEEIKNEMYKKRKYINPDGTIMKPESFPSNISLKKNKIIRNVQIGVVKEDGKVVWTEVSSAPVSDGETACVVVTVDITDRMRAKKLELINIEKIRKENELINKNKQHAKYIIQLNNINKKLKNQIKETAERAAELVSVNVERAQKAAELVKANNELVDFKDNFLSMTAHEYVSPLVPIKTQTQMLLDGVYGELNYDQKKALIMIFKNEEHLFKISNDILKIAKIKSKINKKRIYKFTECKINQIINDAIYETNILVVEKHIKVKIFPFPKIPLFKGDSIKLRQVFINIINNAIKFSPSGSIIKIKIKNKNKKIIIAIKDNGIGIQKRYLSKIFTPYSQVNFGINRKYGGHGLGLFIARDIVAEHKGEIWAESAGLGHGSTFYIKLPMGGVVKSRIKQK